VTLSNQVQSALANDRCFGVLVQFSLKKVLTFYIPTISSSLGLLSCYLATVLPCYLAISH
jgi:hypothetical protein